VSDLAKASALLRRTLPYLTVAVVIGVAYDGWIFYSRWRDARDGEKAQATKQAQDARRLVDALGGDGLKILNFYASPPTVRLGQKALICY
jgi:threonine/homoserine/homoserine lactone efflux protein